MKTAVYIVLGTLVLASGITLFDASDDTVQLIVGIFGVIAGTGMITYGTSRAE